MATENERKWVVPAEGDHVPEATENSIHLNNGGDFIHQAHLATTPDTDVRVRSRQKPTGATTRTLTIKKGQGQSREEISTEIDVHQYNDLESQAEGTIQKVRHEIEIGNHTVELDIYKGDLKGFAVAEVEDPDGFEPPEWFGKEVTGDERYKNKWIANYGLPE